MIDGDVESLVWGIFLGVSWAKILSNEECDLVQIRRKMERFLVGAFGQLCPRGGAPFRIVKQINGNAYKIDFLGDCIINVTFNVANLSPYYEDSEALMHEGDVR